MILQSLSNQKRLRKVYIICIPLCLLFKVALSQNDKNNWSGTITYTSTLSTHHAAPYTEFIYKKWDHFYQQHMEAKLINGKGTAASNISLIDTNYNRDQTGSQIVEQWETEKGSAEGTADTDVSISINTSDKTYTIEVPIPGTTGNKTKTFLCKGCGHPSPDPITTSLGEDATSIFVENEKLSANPNILSGKKTERKQIDSGEGEEIIITQWKLTRGGN